MSQPVKIDVVVPKGSVLVPLLFLIHNNDLQSNNNFSVIIFADDILLYTTFKQSTYLQDSANLSFEIKLISDWIIANRFNLNVNRSRWMLFRSVKTFLKKHKYQYKDR